MRMNDEPFGDQRSTDNPVAKVEVYRDNAGEWRWRAKAANGEPVADSNEGYTDHQHTMSMAERMFPDAEVVVIGTTDS